MKRLLIAAAMAATLPAFAHAQSAGNSPDSLGAALNAAPTSAQPAGNAAPNKPGIDITALTCSLNNTGPDIQGMVENNTGSSQPELELVFVFNDANGKFVSTDNGFATYDPVLPGQDSPFSAQTGDNNPAVASVTVTALDKNNATLPISGETTAPCQ